jgi:two-component system chemotaxis family response regulator WspR
MSMPANLAVDDDDPADAESATVLLVDDQPVIGMVVRKMLAVDPAIAFHVCANATEALATARALRPTVILQDLAMPGSDGLELLLAYRSMPETRDIPIIVLSSNDEPGMKKAAFAMGANDYLVKLPEPIELVARIRYHSRSYMALIQRDNAYRALRRSQKQLLETNRELQRLMNADGLTGLANRRHFDETLAREWERSHDENLPLSLLMIDVDYFKSYNDRLGHLAGDNALKRVAGAVARCCNAGAGLAARFGGEEFALVLPATPAASAQAVAEDLRARIEGLAIAHETPAGPFLTASIGVATLTATPDAGPTALIAAADARLYRAKCDGRNRIVSD